MKAPDRNNYEIWVIDYFDGRLSTEEAELLRRFIANNPDLEIDLDDQLPAADASTETVSFKSDLKRGEDDDFVLNYFEKLRDGITDASVTNSIAADPVLTAELRAFEKTILIADEAVVFTGKEALRKSEEAWFAAEEALVEFEKAIDNRAVVPDTYPRLVADERLQFPAKEMLRREARVVPLFARKTVLRAAAVLLMLLAGAMVLLQRNTGKDAIGIATRRSGPEQKETAVVKSNEPIVQNSNNSIALAKPSPQKKAAVKKRRVAPVVSLAINESGTRDEKQPEVPVAPETKEPAPPLLAEVETRTATIDTVMPEQPVDTDVAVTEAIPLSEIPYADAGDEEEPGKKSLLQRIASLAGDANKLGVAKLDGETEGNTRFRIRLFDFSVERVR